MKKISFIIISLLGLILSTACQKLEKPENVIPEINTLTPEIYSDYVLLKASANEYVDFTYDTSTYFEVSTNNEFYLSEVFNMQGGQMTERYTASLELYGLEPATQYYYRYCAKCGSVIITGNTVGFRTLDVDPKATIYSVECTQKKYYPSGIQFKGETYYYTFNFDITATYTGISQIKEIGIDFDSVRATEQSVSSTITQSWIRYSKSKSTEVNITAFALLKTGKYIYSNTFSKTYTYGASNTSKASMELGESVSVLNE